MVLPIDVFEIVLNEDVWEPRNTVRATGTVRTISR